MLMALNEKQLWSWRTRASLMQDPVFMPKLKAGHINPTAEKHAGQTLLP